MAQSLDKDCYRQVKGGKFLSSIRFHNPVEATARYFSDPAKSISPHACHANMAFFSGKYMSISAQEVSASNTVSGFA